MRIGLIMDFRLDHVLWRIPPDIYKKLDKSCDAFCAIYNAVADPLKHASPHVLPRQIWSFYNGCRPK